MFFSEGKLGATSKFGPLFDLDSLTNSQDLWKGEENSIEIMHIDRRVHRVNCTNIV